MNRKLKKLEEVKEVKGQMLYIQSTKHTSFNFLRLKPHNFL